MFVVSHCCSFICNFFSVADWKYRHAGLMALSAIGEGCHQQMEGILNEIVNFVLLFLQDPVSTNNCLIHNCYYSFKWQIEKPLLKPRSIFQHPRVRYAACNAVGQMATDFAPGFQKKFHEKVSHKSSNTQTWRRGIAFQNVCLHDFLSQVIAALLQTMEDQGNQRVQAHAAAALINFTEDCPKSLLIPYLDNLVKHLHSIMVLKLQEVNSKIFNPSI